MAPVFIDGISILFAVIIVCFAARRWHVIQDRHLIFTSLKLALGQRKSFWAGVMFGVFYLAIFMILGGKGGRVHVLFGRLIWNGGAWEVTAGLGLAILVMMSMTLFVYGVQVMGFRQSGRQCGAGFFGALLALLASFCP
jgi:hypothetical protein